MDSLHITKPEDLITSYSETRAGFIAIALEKNRQATPYVEEARVLQYRIKKLTLRITYLTYWILETA
jgi:type II restriction enzyme